MAKTFNQSVKEYRLHRGLTQTQLAQMCRVSRRTIARIEAGDAIGDGISPETDRGLILQRDRRPRL